MSMVFEHYPEGGGEMLLALALADFSDDEGGKVFPSIPALAKKTRQSERSVQYQLRRMEQIGFISVAEISAGGRIRGKKYKSTEYKIHLEFFSASKKTMPHSGIEGGDAKNASSDTNHRGAISAPLDETPVNIGITDNGENSAPLMERCNLEHLTVQTGTLNGATAVAPNPSYKPPYEPPPQCARNAEPELPDPNTVVVDLIFPSSIHTDQRDAIRVLLSSSGVQPSHWQILIDELHGAQLTKPITNPVGYVRGMAERMSAGLFTAERAPMIAEQRKKREANEQQAATQARKHPDYDQSSQAQLDRLPQRIRESLARLMKQNKGRA
ncbi:MAG: helix-turn-helix domain-containing protein [Gammaproteobacteria bacterium]|nr:helix-turn-helix domain-containing protein [Gammaproteobacteria bacterium]MBU1978832.1 helix-turn-helix domain-containing protein [Gammaproteobacteria bacterium]